MANYYTEFSQIIECQSDEQRAFLRDAFDQLSQNGSDTSVAYAVDRDEGGHPKDIWVYSDTVDYSSIESVVDVVCRFQRKFAIPTPWRLTWAFTCEKPRVGAFSGGGVLCLKGESYWVNADTWLNNKLKELVRASMEYRTLSVESKRMLVNLCPEDSIVELRLGTVEEGSWCYQAGSQGVICPHRHTVRYLIEHQLLQQVFRCVGMPIGYTLTPLGRLLANCLPSPHYRG